VKEASLAEILHTLDYWWAAAHNDHNDGWVKLAYKDNILAVRKSLEEKQFPTKVEETKEEMCF